MSMLKSASICALGFAATTATAQYSTPMPCLNAQCPGDPPCSTFPDWVSSTVLLSPTGGVVAFHTQPLNGTPWTFWAQRGGLFYPEQHTFDPATHGYPATAFLAAQPDRPMVDDQSRVYFQAVLAGVAIDQCPLVRTAMGGGPLEVLLRPGQPAPWDVAITIHSYASCWQVTRVGRVVVQVRLTGSGVTEANNAAFIEFRDGSWHPLAQEGDTFWVDGYAQVMRMPVDHNYCNVVPSENNTYLLRVGTNGVWCSVLMLGELPLSSMLPLYTRGPNAALPPGYEMGDYWVKYVDDYSANAQGDVLFFEDVRKPTEGSGACLFIQRTGRPLEMVWGGSVQVPAPVSTTIVGVDYAHISDSGHITLQGRTASSRWTVISLAPDNTSRVVAYEGQSTERGWTLLGPSCLARADGLGNVVLRAPVRKEWQEGYGVFVWSDQTGLQEILLPGDTVYSSDGSPQTVQGGMLTSEVYTRGGFSLDNNSYVSQSGTYVLSPHDHYDDMFYLASTQDCGDLDFNNDSLFPDPQDVSDFLAVFTGVPCPTPVCDDIDFNNDGLFPDTADIDTLLSAFSGGPCP